MPAMRCIPGIRRPIRGDSGRRIFINANPVPLGGKPQVTKAVLNRGNVIQTTRGQGSASVTNEVATQVNRERIAEMVREVSKRYSVDPVLIHAVIETESNWNPTAVSSRGASGLMQLIPGTAQQMGVTNVFDPKQNIDGGVHYLRTLLERYNGDLDKALAAYNAGPGAVDRAGGIPRYRETQDYVRKVTNSYNHPGSGRMATALGSPHPIYRTVEADGRVVFTNE